MLVKERQRVADDVDLMDQRREEFLESVVEKRVGETTDQLDANVETAVDDALGETAAGGRFGEVGGVEGALAGAAAEADQQTTQQVDFADEALSGEDVLDSLEFGAATGFTSDDQQADQFGATGFETQAFGATVLDGMLASSTGTLGATTGVGTSATTETTTTTTGEGTGLPAWDTPPGRTRTKFDLPGRKKGDEDVWGGWGAASEIWDTGVVQSLDELEGGDPFDGDGIDKTLNDISKRS
jgi:hypothetical protein